MIPTAVSVGSVLKATLGLQLFKPSGGGLGWGLPPFLPEGSQRVCPWALKTEDPLPLSWDTVVSQILESRWTSLKSLHHYRLPSRVDFSLLVISSIPIVFLVCISICTFNSLIAEKLLELSLDIMMPFLSCLVLSRETCYIEVGFPLLS